MRCVPLALRPAITDGATAHHPPPTLQSHHLTRDPKNQTPGLRPLPAPSSPSQQSPSPPFGSRCRSSEPPVTLYLSDYPATGYAANSADPPHDGERRVCSCQPEQGRCDSAGFLCWMNLHLTWQACSLVEVLKHPAQAISPSGGRLAEDADTWRRLPIRSVVSGTHTTHEGQGTDSSLCAVSICNIW